MSVLGNALVAAGATVGVATVAAVATGYQVHLTPEMTQLIIYKGFAAMAAGLIVAGAWVGRTARAPGTRNDQHGQEGRDSNGEASANESSSSEIGHREPLALSLEAPPLAEQSIARDQTISIHKEERPFRLDE